MKILPALVLGASALLASISSAQTWQGEWTDATTLTGATPAWSLNASGGGSILETPNPTTFTSTGTQFAWATPTTGFDGSTPTGSTIEFRMKVNSQESGKDYAGTADIFTSFETSAAGRFEFNIASDKVQFGTLGASFALDTTVLNTYRITILDNAASLYINDNSVATIGGQPGGSNFGVNALRIGDISSSNSVGGATEWEYVRWTNAGTFAPIPEPAAAASLLGVIALGSVLFIRRRRS